MKLRLRKFDPSTMVPEAIVVFNGARGSGKSVGMTHILGAKRKHLPSGIVLSNTEGANGHWGSYVPPIFIHTEFNAAFMKRLTAQQEKRMKRVRKGRWPHSYPPNTFVVLDDMSFDDSLKNSEFIRWMLCNGRHYNFFMLYSMQHAQGIKRDMRGQVQYLFVYFEENLTERKKLHEAFFGFMQYDLFCDILDQCTENYGCLVLDKTKKTRDLTEKLFWWKADPGFKYKACLPRYWEYSRQHFKDESSDTDSDDDTALEPPPTKRRKRRRDEDDEDDAGGGTRGKKRPFARAGRGRVRRSVIELS